MTAIPARERETRAALLEEAWRVREGFPPVLAVDRPRRTVPVSVTGTACSLGCAHCGGHYLRGMRTPQQVPVPHASSYLVSGGCDERGRVPLWRHGQLLDRLRRQGALLNLHPGLVGAEEAHILGAYGHVVSLDWVTDPGTVAEVYGLGVGGTEYEAAYRALAAYLPVVPHLCLGLRGGRMEGEWDALGRLMVLQPQMVVFLVFVPTPGTRYAHCRPPAPEEVASFLARARVALPRSWLALGCMRPPGEYRRRLDPLAVAAGMNRIVMPAPEGVREAQQRGLSISVYEECCALGLVSR